MRGFFSLILAIFYFAVAGRSEVVVFKNGDQLTGDWVRMQDGKLTLKSVMVGEITIPLANLDSFASSKPAMVLLKDGQTVRGQLSLRSSGEWEVESAGQAKLVATKLVKAIHPLEIYEPKRPERSRKPWQNWRGRGNFGYSLVRGDRQAGTISIGFDATRRQPNLPGVYEHHRTHYFLNMLFANTRSFSGVRASANSITSGLRQDFLFTPTNFVFLLTQLDHIQAQSLDLRETYGTGLGHDLLRSRRVVFSFLGGATMVREEYQSGAARRQAFEGLVGEKVSLRLSDRVNLEHRLNFYPNFEGGGRYRYETTSTLSTRFASRLSFNTTFTNRYLSQPLPGHVNHEKILTTGLGFNF